MQSLQLNCHSMTIDMFGDLFYNKYIDENICKHILPYFKKQTKKTPHLLRLKRGLLSIHGICKQDQRFISTKGLLKFGVKRTKCC